MSNDNVKIFAKNKKEYECLIQTVRIFSQVIGMESGIAECTMLVKKDSKRKTTKGIDLSNQKKKSVRSEGKEARNTWEYKKQTLSSKQK